MGKSGVVTEASNYWRMALKLIHVRRKYLLACMFFLVPCVLYSLSTSVLYISEFEQQTPCKIHKLNPWDKTISDYLVEPKPLKCADKHSLVYVDDEGFLQYNQTAIDQYAIKEFKCVYHHIRRKSSDKAVTIEDAVAFTPPTFVRNQVFRVVCAGNAGTVYDFVHVNMAWNQSAARQAEIERETDDSLSIIYFGLDSASRSHALRKLPKSYKYLKENLGAYDFRGYMKVGLNSFPNLVPLLTGHEYTEYAMENILRVHLDGMPFIWTEPEMRRYSTLHTEDRPDISTMNYENSGFKKSPVDYYYRVAGLAMDAIEPQIMAPLGKSSWSCYGNKQHYLLQIDYLKRFISKYTQRLKFAFLWNNQIGHEDFISLGRGDQPLLEFLQFAKANGHLERSILIVGSDHGFRLGGASTTYVGRLENNMPFLMMYVPDVLKKRYPWLHQNLLDNTEKLTSAFDVHETFMDVIGRQYKDDVPSSIGTKRVSRSLFKKHPNDRTCFDAGIPEQYCTCYGANTVNTSHPLVATIAKHVTQHLNFLLDKYKDVCKPLTLRNVSEAKVMYTAEGDADNSHIDRQPGFFKRFLGYNEINNSGRYVLMLYTDPNNALIEAMVDYEKHPAKGPDNKLTVIGEPVRVNKYGNQSHCIEDNVLRQYCICNDVTVL